MAEYDELYLIKNPFFLGSFEKAIKENDNVVIEEGDVTNLEKKTFYVVRAYLALADWEKAESMLSKHLMSTKCTEEEKEKFAKIIKIFIEFSKTGVNYKFSHFS